MDPSSLLLTWVEIISIPSCPTGLCFNDSFQPLEMGSKLTLEFLSGAGWKCFEWGRKFRGSFQGGLEVDADRLLGAQRGCSCKASSIGC
jgi:hypothetical protein